jgi:hypothetical protein
MIAIRAIETFTRPGISQALIAGERHGVHAAGGARTAAVNDTDRGGAVRRPLL